MADHPHRSGILSRQEDSLQASAAQQLAEADPASCRDVGWCLARQGGLE
jgi:hypothetical protein